MRDTTVSKENERYLSFQITNNLNNLIQLNP